MEKHVNPSMYSTILIRPGMAMGYCAIVGCVDKIFYLSHNVFEMGLYLP